MRFILLMLFVLSSFCWSDNSVPTRGIKTSFSEKKCNNETSNPNCKDNILSTIPAKTTQKFRAAVHGSNEPDRANYRVNKNEKKPYNNDSWGWVYIWNWINALSATIISNIIYSFQFVALITTIYVMIKSSRRQLRAYLGVSKITATLIDEKTIHIEVIISNTGQSPANQVIRKIKAEIRKFDDKKITQDIEIKKGKMLISPNSEWNIEFRINDISQEEMRKIRIYEQVIFVWGVVEYRDIFNYKQTLSFCYRANGFPIEKFAGHFEWNIYPEDDGNEST